MLCSSLVGRRRYARPAFVDGHNALDDVVLLDVEVRTDIRWSQCLRKDLTPTFLVRRGISSSEAGGTAGPVRSSVATAILCLSGG
jgi:hypothetical protein